MRLPVYHIPPAGEGGAHDFISFMRVIRDMYDHIHELRRTNKLPRKKEECQFLNHVSIFCEGFINAYDDWESERHYQAIEDARFPWAINKPQQYSEHKTRADFAYARAYTFLIDKLRDSQEAQVMRHLRHAFKGLVS